MKKTLLAWIVFLGCMGVEMAIDYTLRIRDGNVQTGGIPEPLWFILQLSFSAVSLRLAYAGTLPMGVLWKRILAVAAQAATGLFLYGFIGLYYVVSSGIDSL